MATVTEPTEELARFKREQERLRESGVEYCLAAYVDVHGIAKCKAVPIDHFVTMMQGSELFTGAALDGLGQEPSDDELSVRPDLDAITVLPWEPTVAWAPGQLHFHDDPWPMDSRTVLRRQLARAADRGLTFNLGIETEFFLVQRENGTIVPANPKDTLSKAAYDIVGLLENMSLHGRAREIHERPRVGRPLVRPRGRQQSVRVRLLLHRRDWAWPTA